MGKILVGTDQYTYTFDASAQTVSINGITGFAVEQVLLITNITDNEIIYNFADPSLGGSVAGNVITLVYDTTSMSDSDILQIFMQTPEPDNLPLGTVNFSPVRYGIKTIFSTTKIDLSGGQTVSIYKASSNGITDGQIEGFALYTDDDDYEVIIEINGVEVSRIDSEELNDDLHLNADMDAEIQPFSFYVKDDGIQFVFWPRTPVDFTTDFELKIKNLNSGGMDLESYLIHLRTPL